MSADMIATLTGLRTKSVANICWVYRWSPEKLNEMIERSKCRGPKGDDARTGLRRYFIMHPEQRPAQQKPVDHPEPAEVHVVDSNARGRLDLLWKFSTAQNERLIEVEHRLDALDKLTDQLTSLAGRVDELERRVAVMHRDVAGLKQASEPEALPVTLDRHMMGVDCRIQDLQHYCSATDKQLAAHKQKLDKLSGAISELWQCIEEQHDCLESFSSSTMERQAACEKQILRLQNVLVRLAEALHKEEDA